MYNKKKSHHQSIAADIPRLFAERIKHQYNLSVYSIHWWFNEHQLRFPDKRWWWWLAINYLKEKNAMSAQHTFFLSLNTFSSSRHLSNNCASPQPRQSKQMKIKRWNEREKNWCAQPRGPFDDPLIIIGATLRIEYRNETKQIQSTPTESKSLRRARLVYSHTFICACCNPLVASAIVVAIIVIAVLCIDEPPQLEIELLN